MLSCNHVGPLITKPITTLQHLTTLIDTSLNYTSLHLSTLHFLSFTLHASIARINMLQIYIGLWNFQDDMNSRIHVINDFPDSEFYGLYLLVTCLKPEG